MGAFFLLPVVAFVSSEDIPLDALSNEDYVQIFSSCSDIDNNGLFYVKPMADGPIIPVICSHGYTMIDPSLDVDMTLYGAYLTSYVYAIREDMDTIIPDMDDLATFRDWWIPAQDDTSFHVAYGCDSCEATDDFGESSSYYTSSFSFCFAGVPSGTCEEQPLPFACNTCDSGDNYNRCSAMQMDADAAVQEDHTACMVYGLSYRPMMSLVRQACTCYAPNSANPQDSYSVLVSDLPAVKMEPSVRTSLHHIDDSIVWYVEDKELPKDMQHCYDTVRYLSNDDFAEGTFRIMECGVYILAEDIVLNFNAAEDQFDPDSSPNSVYNNDLNWYPSKSQEQTYAGLYSYEGTYSLGFFAGITIEADYVTIDLNGHTLEQSRPFYLQQRFFTLISMSAKYFLPNQGPSNWLMDEQFFPKHVEIYGGTLGLSSHHGIFGLSNEHVFIHDIQVTKFETHGIQCNGCQHVRIERAIVGPMMDNIPVVGRYTIARAMLPRFQQLGEEYGDHKLKLAYMDDDSEGELISDMIDRLVNQMDMMYHSVINDVVYDEDDAEWIAAKKLFANPSGWMDGGSTYGMVFNGEGAAVRGIGYRTDGTSDIKLRDVEVFGIYNQVLEKMQTVVDPGTDAVFGARTRLLIFDTIDWVAVTDQLEDGETVKYVGDAYTDLIFAIQEHITSWSYLHALIMTQAEIDFVTNGAPFRDIWSGGSPAANDKSAAGCNTDILLHSVKGAIGVRFDGTQEIDVEGLYIHDVVNWAAVGNDWCGEYDGPDIRDEKSDIQYGYTGTRANGLLMSYAQGKLSNVRVEHVESYHGEANGVVVYKECDVELSQVSVDGVDAGSKLTSHEVDALVMPNLVPQACAVSVHEESVVMLTDHVTVKNVNGFQHCRYAYDEYVDEQGRTKMLVNARNGQVDEMPHSSTRFSGGIFPVVLLSLGAVALAVFDKVKKSNSTKSKSFTAAESTPLLN